MLTESSRSQADGMPRSPAGVLILAATTLVAVAISAASAVAIVYDAYIVALVLGAVILAALSYRYPRTTAGLIIVASLLGNQVGQHFPSTKIVDDAAILIYTPIVVLAAWRASGKVRGVAGWRSFLLFLVIGALASLIRAPLTLAAQDAYLFAKGALFAWAVSQLDWQPADIRRALRWAAVVIGALFLFVVLNLALPGVWYRIFAVHGVASTRFAGIPSLIGLFVHPGVLGQVMALAASLFVAYSLAFRRWRWPVLGAVASVAAVVLTFRRKALIGLVLACAAAVVAKSRRRLLVSLVILGVVVVAALAAWPLTSSMVSKTVNEYVDGASEAPRIVLYKTSAQVAYDEFPLGAGFGRFGGWISSTHYSPVYVKYGVDQIPGMGPGSSYLTDTFWPAILGETGVFGLIAYALFLLQVFLLAARLSRDRDPQVMFLGMLGCAWSVEFVVESVAAASYSSPPAYLLFFALAGIMSAVGRRVLEPVPSRTGAWRNPLRRFAARRVQSRRRGSWLSLPL